MSDHTTLTDAEQDALVLAAHSAFALGEDMLRGMFAAVERIVAARVAEARADERERIAQSIEAHAAWVKRLANENRLLHDTGGYLTEAARIAREGADR